MAASDIAWATDAVFVNGSSPGADTKVEPSSAVKAEGNCPGLPVPAQRLNWWMNAVGNEVSTLETGLAAVNDLINFPSPIARVSVLPISNGRPSISAGLAAWDCAYWFTARANSSILQFTLGPLPQG